MEKIEVKIPGNEVHEKKGFRAKLKGFFKGNKDHDKKIIWYMESVWLSFISVYDND